MNDDFQPFDLNEELEQYKYEDKDTTLIRSAMFGFVVNPLLDSAVKNAMAKGSGLAMYNALRNGGIYSQYTFLGGHTLFGGEKSFLKKIPGIKNIIKETSAKHSKIFGLGNFNFSYISPINNKKYFTDFARTGIKDPSSLLETGYGFGTKLTFDKGLAHRPLFKELKKLSASELGDYSIMTGKVKEYFEDVRSGIQEFTKNNFTNLKIDKLSQKSELYTTMKRIQNKMEPINKLHNIINDSTKDIKGLNDINKSLQLNVRKFMERYNIGENKLFSDLKSNNFENIINAVTSKENLFEKVDVLEKSLLQKFKQGKISKFMESDLMKAFTGVSRGVALNAIEIAAGIGSAISIAQQEDTITGVNENHNYNYSHKDFLNNLEVESSIQTHSISRQEDYIGFEAQLNRRNVSREALSDIDKIDIDSSLSSQDNFTIF